MTGLLRVLRRLHLLTTPFAPKRKVCRLGVLVGVVAAQLIGLCWLLSLSSQPVLALTRPHQPNVPASVFIEPANATIAAGLTRLYTATVLNSSGGTISPPQGAVAWTVVTGRGSIVSSGPVTALVRVTTTAGSYPNAVIATASNGVFGTASFLVTPGPISVINVAPALATLTVGDGQAFTATGTDIYGNSISDFTVTWSANPSAGAITPTGPRSASFTAGSTPGAYPQAITATSGAANGFANVSLEVGSPSRVIVTPDQATLAIGSLQPFSANVVDRFGNSVPGPGVLWQSSMGAIESSGPYTALIRTGNKAGAFPTGVQAFFGPIAGNAAITVPADPTGDLQISADPGAITTDGVNISAIGVQVTDQYGNAVGAGVPVALAIDQCAGTCALGTNAANTDAAGRVATALRSDNRSVTATVTSLIRVSASVNGINGPVSRQVNVNGTFTPFRSHLPVSNRDTSLNNHTSCTALRITPPQSVSQPPNNAFNIYRFTATKPSYSMNIQNYRVAGSFAVYRIVQDNCATNDSISIATVRSPIPIGTSGVFQLVLTNAFASGSDYLVVINTTGAGSSLLYRITVQ
jgi:hypothetical protein